jgi:hypothetical protein
MIVLLLLMFLGRLIACLWLTAIFALYKQSSKPDNKPWTALYPD